MIYKLTGNSRQLIVFFVAFLLLPVGAQSAGCRTESPADTVCFKKHCYSVEVVSRDPDRMRGLQGRKQLDSNAGMLFIFPESAEHSFWMKETLIPLDMIWMDYSRRVVHIESGVPPCQQDPCPVYSPLASALYVLEINAGEARKQGIVEGEEAGFALNKYLKK